jgi:surface polysaccharide O-acyltransferase-like enzyme
MTQTLNKPLKIEDYQISQLINYPRSEKTAWAYYVAIISCFTVVWSHISAAVVLNTTNNFYWMVSNVADSMARWCVPAFIMLSGYLLLNPDKKYTLTSFYRKRAGRILLPFVFWIFFYAGVTVTRRYLAGAPVTIKDCLIPMFTGHAFYHLWYMYMLPGIYLIIPIMKMVTKAINKRHLVALCAILLIIPMGVEAFIFFFKHNTGFINGSPVYTWFLYFLGYVLAGYLIGHEQRRIISTPILVAMVFSSIAVTAMGCYLLSNRYSFNLGSYFYSPFCPSVVIASLSAFALAKKLFSYAQTNNFLEKGYQLAFGIFLIHPVFIILLDHFNIKPTNFNPIISIPAITALTFLLSASTALLMSRIPYIRKLM